ncbi:MAG: hypothetical protein D8M53_03210 [Armatimonadetes bacterium]|nr:hypothetical protein [Armatimonadota bacterium]
MRLRFMSKETGEELLHESRWEGELPRVGDVVELHDGATHRWVVEEVDWVFEDAPPDQKDDIPLRCAVILVGPEAAHEKATEAHEVAADPHHDWRGRSNRRCVCGHPEDLHTPIRCTGKAGFCDCTGFVEATGP